MTIKVKIISTAKEKSENSNSNIFISKSSIRKVAKLRKLKKKIIFSNLID
jgi:hypothetical protein